MPRSDPGSRAPWLQNWTAEVAVLATDGVEQVELDGPGRVLEEAGGEPEQVSLDGGEITACNHLDEGDTRKVDTVASTADPEVYAALVLPGGVVNGDFLRADADAVAFVTSFFEAVVVDGDPVTSRDPDDLDAFGAAIVELFAAVDEDEDEAAAGTGWARPGVRSRGRATRRPGRW